MLEKARSLGAMIEQLGGTAAGGAVDGEVPSVYTFEPVQAALSCVARSASDRPAPTVSGGQPCTRPAPS
eukprot:3921557-Prymnesium_polylepis.1